MHLNFLICGPILPIQSFSESLNSLDHINFKFRIKSKNRNSYKNRKIFIPVQTKRCIQTKNKLIVNAVYIEKTGSGGIHHRAWSSIQNPIDNKCTLKCTLCTLAKLVTTWCLPLDTCEKKMCITCNMHLSIVPYTNTWNRKILDTSHPILIAVTWFVRR